jgi:membrane fusion protein, multidrug efflux system
VRRIVIAVALIAMAAAAAVGWRHWGEAQPLLQAAIDQIGTLAGKAAQANQPSGQPGGAPKQQLPPVAVVTAPVAKKPMPVRFETIGTVQPIAAVAIKSRLDAQIVQVHVRDGQEVKAGELLFTMDSRQLEAQIRQTEAVVARDRAQLAQARRDLERLTDLAAKEYAARTKVDDTRTLVTALEAAVRASEASTESLRVQLSYYTIKAPIDGRVGAVTLKTGNVAKNNETTMVTINQMRPIYVSFSVPQASLGEIRAAMAAGVVTVSAGAPSDSGPPATGQLAFIDNAVDAASGTINLKAAFPNAADQLWPGLFVNVGVTLKVEQDAIVVPSTAVQLGQNGSYVFTVGPENTAEFKPVTVSRQVGNESVITSGLKPGETVVTDGAYRLVRGAKMIPRGAGKAKTS